MTFLPTLDGEWINIPSSNRLSISCCSCGLVHKLTFRVLHGKVRFKATRDPKETRNRRRQLKLKKTRSRKKTYQLTPPKPVQV